MPILGMNPWYIAFNQSVLRWDRIIHWRISSIYYVFNLSPLSQSIIRKFTFLLIDIYYMKCLTHASESDDGSSAIGKIIDELKKFSLMFLRLIVYHKYCTVKKNERNVAVPWHLVWFSSGCHPSGQTHCFSMSEGSRTTQRWSQPHPPTMAGRISTVPEPKCWPSSTSVNLSIAVGETKEKPPSPLELATALPPNRRQS